MPLSQNNKTESKSIEDLIAQLEAPPPVEAHDEHSDRKSKSNKRTNSGSLSNNHPTASNNSHGSGTTGGGGGGGSSTAYYDPVLQKNIILSKKYTKTLRSAKGRGLPKKGGSGGNFTWGAPGSELGAFGSLDTNDPNYDSEQDSGNLVMVCVENEATSGLTTDSDGGSGAVESSRSTTKQSPKQQQLELEDFDKHVKIVILEYFENGDAVEVIDHLKRYSLSSKIKSQLLAFIIQIACEQSNTCKELISRLLHDFHLELFSTIDFESAFNILLHNLNELTLDNPGAAKTIGTFIARCIADKVLPNDYFKRVNINTNDENLKETITKALEEAEILTDINDHLFHLSHIWGHNQGGFTAVRDLTDKINILIQEFYDSGDIDEAIRCIKDLDVPHFHHELVFEALDFALQKGDDYAIELVTNLLKRLWDSVIVTYDQLKMGFMRIYDLLPDIYLDVPNAYLLMEKLLTICQTKGIIGNDIANLRPNGRQRGTSENESGRSKSENVQQNK